MTQSQLRKYPVYPHDGTDFVVGIGLSGQSLDLRYGRFSADLVIAYSDNLNIDVPLPLS
jgi:hypothetical protein